MKKVLTCFNPYSNGSSFFIGTKSIWIPKSVLKDTQPAETNENNFLVKGQKYKHKMFGICEVVGFTSKSVILDTTVGTKELLTKIAPNFLEKI